MRARTFCCLLRGGGLGPKGPGSPLLTLHWTEFLLRGPYLCETMPFGPIGRNWSQFAVTVRVPRITKHPASRNKGGKCTTEKQLHKKHLARKHLYSRSNFTKVTMEKKNRHILCCKVLQVVALVVFETDTQHTTLLYNVVHQRTAPCLDEVLITGFNDLKSKLFETKTNF